MRLVSQLDSRHVEAGGTSWTLDERFSTLRSNVRRSQPVRSRIFGVPPFDLNQLLALLSHSNEFLPRRLRVLVLLRIVTMMRPAEPASISRSSLVSFRVPGSSRVVVGFTYRTKQSTALNRQGDSNHVEYLSEPVTSRTLCPATQLLEWAAFVATLPRAAEHDALFVQKDVRQLSADSVRRIVLDFMHEHPQVFRVWVSHSLRAITAMHLQQRNVPRDQILARGGWMDITDNHVFRSHYTSYRQVSCNFADLLLREDR